MAPELLVVPERLDPIPDLVALRNAFQIAECDFILRNDPVRDPVAGSDILLQPSIRVRDGCSVIVVHGRSSRGIWIVQLRFGWRDKQDAGDQYE